MDDWEEIEIIDPTALLSCANQLIEDALSAKDCGDFAICTKYISKALDMLSIAEIEYPKEVEKLRNVLESI